MALRRLDARGLREVFDDYASLLAEHEDTLNELNVFPTPDADTGTNLRRTIEGIVEDTAGTEELTDGMREAALLHAQGNAGVITSQVVGAFCDTLEERRALDAAGLAEALQQADAQAREAVGEPVEGTIVSVLRRAAERAADADDLGQLLVDVRHAVREAVDATPTQLDALAEAGVVDSGAWGFELLWEALVARTTGEPAQVRALEPGDGGASGRAAGHRGGRYEVQYLARGADAERLRRRLVDAGDSVVVVGGEGQVTVHLHTDDPDRAQRIGAELADDLDEVQVTDLEAQVERAGA